MSSNLQWECVRKFNSFMVKRDGAFFSTEAGNLMNKHSYKFSGLIHQRVIRVEAAENGVALSRRVTKAGNKVAKAFCKPSVIKASVGYKNAAAKVGADLSNIYYRTDLISAAKARAAAIIKAKTNAKKH